MRRAVVAIILAATPPSGASAQSSAIPTTVPPGVLDMGGYDQAGLTASLMLRALKDGLTEQRPAGTVLDWYPATAGGFRVTGGFRDAPEAARHAATDDHGTFAPYLGLGWQGAVFGESVLIGLDFGAFYRGRPEVRVVDAKTDESTAEGRLARLASGSIIAPVFSLTFTYRF